MNESDNRRSRLELVGSAAAGIAHDLNNQFTLILNHLAVLDVASARDAVMRCSSLTSALLAYCRGDAATLRSTDLARVVRRFAATVAIPPGVRLLVQIDGSASTVLADESGIERALDNLVRNACAAMGESGRITISVAGGVITVQDCGPGIAAENLRKIFEPFFSTRGSGLGLAIVRDIMRRHGGSATVESRLGEGARFVLRFRRAEMQLKECA